MWMLLSNKHGCKRGSVLVNITYKAVFCLGGMQLFIEVTVCRRPCCQIKENTFYVRGKKETPPLSVSYKYWMLPTWQTLKPTSGSNSSVEEKKVRVNDTVIFLRERNHCPSLWAGTVCISITSQGINCFSTVSRMASACWTKSRSKVISQIAWEQIPRLSHGARCWILKMVLENVGLHFERCS